MRTAVPGEPRRKGQKQLTWTRPQTQGRPLPAFPWGSCCAEPSALGVMGRGQAAAVRVGPRQEQGHAQASGCLTLREFLPHCFCFSRGKKKKLSVSVTDLRSGCSLLESQHSRDKCWYKEKFASFRRPATWKEGGPTSKDQRPTAGQGKGSKRGISGAHGREGAPCHTAHSALDSHPGVWSPVV